MEVGLLDSIAGAALLGFLFVTPPFVLFATARARGAAPWPWPRGVAVGLALGVAVVALVATALGVCGVFSLRNEALGIAIVAGSIVAIGRGRFAWPLGTASAVEGIGFCLVAAVACGLFFGRPFEMLFGERDATVYTVSGIGLARQGSLVLHDRASERVGADAIHRFYPLRHGEERDNRIGLRPRWDPLESTCRHASLSIL